MVIWHNPSIERGGNAQAELTLCLSDFLWFPAKLTWIPLNLPSFLSTWGVVNLLQGQRHRVRDKQDGYGGRAGSMHDLC